MGSGATLDRKIYSFFKKGVFDGDLQVLGNYIVTRTLESAVEEYALKVSATVEDSAAGICKFGIFGNMLLTTGALVAEVWGGYSKTRLSAGQATGQVGAHYFELVVDTAVANCPSASVAQLASWINGNLNDEHGVICVRDYGSKPMKNLFNIMDHTSGTGKLWYNNTLKIRIGSAAKYLVMSDAEDSLAFTGAKSNYVLFSSTLSVADNMARDRSYIGIGKYSSHISVDLSAAAQSGDRCYLTQLFVDSVANPGNANMYLQGAYYRMQVKTVDQANLSIGVMCPTLDVDQDCKNAYAIKAELDASAAGISIGQNMFAISGFLEVATSGALDVSGSLGTAAGIFGFKGGTGLTLTGSSRTFALMAHSYISSTLTAVMLINAGGIVTSALLIDDYEGTSCVNGIELDLDATVGLAMHGKYKNGILFTGQVDLTGANRNASYFGIGTYDVPISVDRSTQNALSRTYLMQLFATFSGDTNATSDYAMGFYPKFLVNTAAQVKSSFAVLSPTIDIDVNVKAAYALKAELDASGSAFTAVTNNLFAVSGFIDFGSGTKNFDCSGAIGASAGIFGLDGGAAVTLQTSSRIFALIAHTYAAAKATGVVLINVGGTVTDAALMIDPLSCVSCPIGIHLHAGSSVGIQMVSSPCVTALQIAIQTLTNVIDFTGCGGSAVTEDNLAAPNKAGTIRILTPAGAVAYINYYDGTPA